MSIVDGQASTEKVGVVRTGVRRMIRHDVRARTSLLAQLKQ